MAIQKSGEDYLEAILVLQKEKGTVRSIDVARHMAFSKPSVSRAVGNLRKDGLLEVGTGGELIFTAQGRKIAEEIYERHTLLTDLFVRLDVPEKIAAEDACNVEHVINDVTFRQIKKAYARYFLAEPKGKNTEASSKSAKETKKKKKKKKK